MVTLAINTTRTY